MESKFHDSPTLISCVHFGCYNWFFICFLLFHWNIRECIPPDVPISLTQDKPWKRTRRSTSSWIPSIPVKKLTSARSPTPSNLIGVERSFLRRLIFPSIDVRHQHELVFTQRYAPLYKTVTSWRVSPVEYTFAICPLPPYAFGASNTTDIPSAKRQASLIAL